MKRIVTCDCTEVRWVIVARTTGKLPTLSSGEEETLLSTAKEIESTFVKIIAAAGTNDTKVSIEETT